MTVDDQFIRIFISSTFKDMAAERDALVRRVFPAIRAEFRPRVFDVLEIDLRWGISEAQAESGEVLPLLMQEINRCRPCFLGVLGDHYGSVPDPELLHKHLSADFPDLINHAGCSVTELEIIHGVLSNNAAPPEAVFLERTFNLKDGVEFTEPAENNARQQDLIRRVKKSGAQVLPYHSREEFESVALSAVRQIVEHVVSAKSTRRPNLELPETVASSTSAPAPEEFETEFHAAFAQDRRRDFIDRAGTVGQLVNWLATDPTTPLLLLGPTGIGKSTLIANLADRERSSSPVFEHYVGASTDSADPITILHRIAAFLDDVSGAERTPMPTQASLNAARDVVRVKWHAAEEAFARSETQALLFIDGLDVLSTGADLRWLPDTTNGPIKLIASLAVSDTASPAPENHVGQCFAAAEEKGWIQRRLDHLPDADRRALVAAVLHRWGRELPEEMIDHLVSHPLAGIPLFVKTVLQELRVSAVQKTLGERLNHYAETQTLAATFARFLGRLELDNSIETTQAALTTIWASRAGINEREVLDIANLTPLDWSRLRLDLGETIRFSNGRIVLAHDAMRDAVRTRYLPNDGAVAATHRRLADHFNNAPTDARQAEELPHQLLSAEDHQQLARLLSDLNRFDHFRQRGDAELLKWWLAIAASEGSASRRLAQSIAQNLPKSEAWTVDIVALVARVLDFLRYAEQPTPEIVAQHETVLTVCKRLYGDDAPQTITSINNLAEILRVTGSIERSAALHQELLQRMIDIHAPDDHELLQAKTNYALALEDLGQFDEAIALHEDVLKHFGGVPGGSDTAVFTTIGCLASLQHRIGKFVEAIENETTVFNLRREKLGREHPETLMSRNNLGIMLLSIGQLSEAVEHQTVASESAVRVLGSEHPDTLAYQANLAKTQLAIGDTSGAVTKLRQIQQRAQRVLGTTHPTTLTILNTFAQALNAAGELSEALKIGRRVFEVSQTELGPNHPATLTAQADLSLMLRDNDKLSEAKQTARDVLEKRQRVLGQTHYDTVTAMANLANILTLCDALAEARALEEDVLEHRRTDLGEEHPATITAMSNFAMTLSEIGELAQAETLQREVLRTTQRQLGKMHADTALCQNNLAVTLGRQQRYEEAIQHLQCAVSTTSEELGEKHPDTLRYMGQLAYSLHQSERLEEARELEEKVLQERRELHGNHHIETIIAIESLARTAYEMEALKMAIDLEREVFELRVLRDGPDHDDTKEALQNLRMTEQALAAQKENG